MGNQAPGGSEIGPEEQPGSLGADGPPPSVADQTLADADQTSADSDQTSADSDQAAADHDQAAADHDQAASDLDLQHGGDAALHETTRHLRDRGSRQRHEAAQERVEAATARDAIAMARDRAAASRDRAAAIRDVELEEAVELAEPDGRSDDRQDSEHPTGAAARVWAAEFRARAAADREQAALDREQAGRDRAAGQADRDALLQRLVLAETDELTGARTRAAGLADLDREIARARRTAGPLATAYVDVVGLKKVNDTKGHAAGDVLLQHAVRAIREHLRAYDLIVRMGGDEFLCVMSDATVEIAHRRFDAVQAELAADATERCEIKFGIAALEADDSAAELVERADSQLPASRQS